ncbi:hypothetical protein V1358_09375 [Pseudoalteromonas sp. YIC-656]|uniref:hypothetical protein n=1 Tax=Pseudoalteromonas pernae TaxID=3118054 RepID=UPI003241E353
MRLYFTLFTFFTVFYANTSYAKILIGLSSENGESLKYSQQQFIGHLESAYNCVVEGLNGQYSVTTVPQARLIKMLADNEIDIAMPLLLLPERDSFAKRSQTIYKVNYELITHPHQYDLNLDTLRSKVIQQGLVYKRGTGARSLLFRYLELNADSNQFQEHQVNTWRQSVDFVRHNRAAVTALPSVIAKDIPLEYFDGLERIKMPTPELGFYMSRRFSQTTLAESINALANQCAQQA